MGVGRSLSLSSQKQNKKTDNPKTASILQVIAAISPDWLAVVSFLTSIYLSIHMSGHKSMGVGTLRKGRFASKNHEVISERESLWGGVDHTHSYIVRKCRGSQYNMNGKAACKRYE